MLRENDKVWERDKLWIEVLRQRSSNKGKNASAQKDRRIREKGKMWLERLGYLATKLSEDQTWQIFTKERLEPIVAALLVQGKNFDQQLALAEMFIQNGAKLYGRPEIDDGTKLIRNGADVPAENAKTVLIAAALNRVKFGGKNSTPARFSPHG